MSLAFGTILVFLILIPGIVFRRTYFHGVFSREAIKTTAMEEVVGAIIPGILFQAVAVLFLKLFPVAWQVNFEHLGYLLSGVKEDHLNAAIFRDIYQNLHKIFFYNLLLWILAGACGYGLKTISQTHCM